MLTKHRHICIDFADGLGIAIRTTDTIERVVERVSKPECWKNGIVPKITNVYVQWW